MSYSVLFACGACEQRTLSHVYLRRAHGVPHALGLTLRHREPTAD